MKKDFDTKACESEISQEDMALINRFTQKALSAEEVFTFSVVLCDNDIDRDYERFSEDALQKLAELFVGKTAIRDHSMKSGDQSARTYKAQVVTDTSRKNKLGENYVYLKAWCYMPRLDKNRDLIAEIKAGIVKEVSVGCAVAHSVCSVCGKSAGQNACGHVRGSVYNGELCYYTLREPTDAYEWSFVAVPAQKNAGVTKKFAGGENEKMDILKQMEQLQAENAELKALAEAGRKYRAGQETALVKAFVREFPMLDNSVCEELAKALSSEGIDAVLKAFAQKSAKLSVPQLCAQEEEQRNGINAQFKFN